MTDEELHDEWLAGFYAGRDAAAALAEKRQCRGGDLDDMEVGYNDACVELAYAIRGLEPPEAGT